MGALAWEIRKTNLEWRAKDRVGGEARWSGRMGVVERWGTVEGFELEKLYQL